MNKTTLSRKIFILCNTLLMLFMILICLYPIMYVLFASLSDSNAFMAHTGLLLKPVNFSMAAYEAVAKNPLIASGYANTLFIVTAGVAINITLTSLGAYFLSHENVRFKNFIMMMITFTMFFNGGIIPFFITVKSLGMYNTLWALIIPTAVNTFNLIIMRTSFQSIPKSLKEAAHIDGASHVVILTKIVLPLSKAMIAVMVLFYGVGHWNAWFYSMIFLNDKGLFPLQLVLREILIQNDTASMTLGTGTVDGLAIAETIKYAVIIVATLPILCIYPFLQKYFVKGVMIGAVKG